MPCLACIDMTIYWHGKAWLSFIILFVSFSYSLSFENSTICSTVCFYRFLLKSGAKILLLKLLAQEKVPKVILCHQKDPKKSQFCIKNDFLKSFFA